MTKTRNLIDLADARELCITGSSVDLAAISPDSTPGAEGGKDAKEDGERRFDDYDEELADLQERMFARAAASDAAAPSVLVVLQGMDAAGKGGIVRHVFGSVDPQGLQLASFKRPTEEELAHDFLWRIERRLPAPGHIGVFDRSHYEDVLVQRVRELAPADEIERRYGAIVEFERGLVARGTRVIKVFLHVSKSEQEQRLRERIERDDKHWKYNPGDIDERMLWDDYQRAYEIAIQRTATPEAPWWVVPADRKWYARLLVKSVLLDTLRGLDLDWPAADFDPAEELRRLDASR